MDKTGLQTLDLPPWTSAYFDIEAFDEAIRIHGARFVHYKAMICPVGKIDIYDSRRPHDHHANCSNGYLYTKAGTVTGLFINNEKRENKFDSGLMDWAGVNVTIARHYDGTTELASILPFDRLYLDDESILVENWQLVESSVTGQDKLNFPATEVVDLVDTDGIRHSNSEFTLVNGQIHWNAGKGPGTEIDMNRGKAYSVRYRYRPYWYVARMFHEIRVVRSVESDNMNRMPQSFFIQREYVFENEMKDENISSPRQQRAPRESSFGPR